MKGFSFRRPDDFHLHLRQGEALGPWTRASARHFGRALIMPNTLPPVSDPETARSYRAAITEAALADPACGGFTPLLAFKILPGMGRAQVAALAAEGCVAGKYYPAGATTNSADGLSSVEAAQEALSAMEELGLVLCVHAEDPEAPVLEREGAFLPVVKDVCEAWPRLRIVVEHLSCASSVEWISAMPSRVAATITAHHLAYCLDELMGEGLDPHLYCKPVLKTARDRDALRAAAFSGDARFFFGSDSAPHPRARKEGPRAPAGVFSAPASLSILLDLFARSGHLERFEAFVSEFGSAFYGLQPNEARLRVVEARQAIPEEIAGAVPLMAGRVPAWDLAPLV